jgi:hypothetical protein
MLYNMRRNYAYIPIKYHSISDIENLLTLQHSLTKKSIRQFIKKKIIAPCRQRNTELCIAVKLENSKPFRHLQLLGKS